MVFYSVESFCTKSLVYFKYFELLSFKLFSNSWQQYKGEMYIFKMYLIKKY